MSEARRGPRNHNWGKHLSDETKRKISEANRGKPGWNKGGTAPWVEGEENPAKRPEVRAKIGASMRGRPRPDLAERNRARKGSPSPLRGTHLSEETRRKISEANKGKLAPQVSKESRERAASKIRGRPRPESVKRKLREYTGERASNWRGGISFGPYCPKFNREFKERVRAFWGYACGLCGKSQAENGKRLHVHHVNYRKDACCDEEVARQFIPLCASCHIKTNFDRTKWEKKLSRIIEKKYGGRCYFHQGEQLAAWGA